MNVDRRTFLLGAAAAVFTGCAGGKNDPRLGTQARAQARKTVAIDYASYYAPIDDVKRLVGERAAAVGADVTFSNDPSGTAAQVKQLKAWTGDRGGFNVIAVAPFDVAAVEPIAADALKRGIAIVSYVTPLKNQSAGIVVDRGEAGRLLATDAVKHGKRALVVRPPSAPAVPLPFAPGFADAEKAIGGVVEIAATVDAQADADAQGVVETALKSDASIELVLCWNDLTAIGAASAVNARDIYVGGLGAPSLSDPRALRFHGALQALVAARISDLADALVDLPLAYAQGKKPGSRSVPVTLLKQGEPEVDAFASDFAAS
ncbi:substrate-binding domain-containing protein [Solirubrobacter ginsenosidimutans]|uniref:Substrate-binding domain-containing protein n=1 Tax=Solirubrobacter ginsenosidimutans TaxID=490573 RepID=A0A9X3MTE0_9ACTN|nr:substrate-binding domain-containing protein [Solirubrobacter ginsenosidimutans]MDA0162249.1 substrate-binding domain-containing protein [Solirubrobacter ginsenosidimutans]